MEPTARSGVRAGSVWESRMQSDDVKKGIFRAFDVENDEHNDGEGDENEKKSEKASPSPEDGGAAVAGKRGTWNSGQEKRQVQIGGSRSDQCEDQFRRIPLKITRPRSNIQLQTKKSPVQTVKARSEPVTPARRSKSGLSGVKEKSSPVSVKKARSESMEGVVKSPGRIRKSRSELYNGVVRSDEFESDPPRKAKSSSAEDFEDLKQQPEPGEDDKGELDEDKPQNPDHKPKEFGVSREKIISTKNSNTDEGIDNDNEDKGDEEEEEKEEEEEAYEEEIEMEKKSVRFDFNQSHDRTSSRPSAVGKVSPPAAKRATSGYTVPTEEQSFCRSQSKLQSLVDLVMWREASRTSLVFGTGTFLIVSSSYANDLNFSLISVAAYVGLVYLAANFVFRSILHRGEGEREGDGEILREEEIVRMVRAIMPYLNELLLTLRAFFSGDPSTTIKMGVVLYVLARCGSSITIWKMTKLGFFIIFTVPKIFTSYSACLTAYAQFWVRRFRDAWESCTHKKAVALAIFTLVWNLSSVVARVWAVFILYVALRYYQQTIMVKGGWRGEEEEDGEEKPEEEEGGQPQVKRASTVVRKQIPTVSPSNRIFIPNKLKKLS
ncbi:PREDICTED: reticulon-like protein B21 [Tarenaya hassleriana]|uniref:reticulon-like protein B21 n=1 Tax=Tarenaya hassleriana TaxID=28532 RepID=UPI0008FD83BC|nr:PREDICTED: reticulon-like protein B21 [Tarenaya hassleriana]